MARKIHHLLQRRLFITLLLLALVPMTILGLFCIERINAIYAEKIHTVIEALTHSKARALDTFLQERVAQIKNLTAIHSYAELSDPQRLSHIFTTMQANGRSFVDLGILGRDGMHKAYVGPYDLWSIDYKDTKWFQEVMHNTVYVSDVFMGFRKSPHFIIAVLRHDGDTTFIVRATIDLEAINALLQRQYAGKEGDAFLINKEGVLQTSSRHYGQMLDRITVTLPPNNEARVTLLPSPPQGGAASKDAELVVAVKQLSALQWYVLVIEDVSDSLASLRHLRFLIALCIILGGLVACGAALWATRALMEYVHELDSKQTEIDKQLAHSSKMSALGKMASGVAHEVNNPLMLIRESAGWVLDLMQDEDPKAVKNYDEIIETTTKIEQHVDRAKNITHRMLGFGRSLDPSRHDVFVPAIIDQAIEFLQAEANHRHITIERHYTENTPSLVTDAAQLQQVFINIIDNALDAIGKDGSIRIHAACLPDEAGLPWECEVRIHDSGPGIPPAVLQRIFDPFYSTKAVGEGTGLGLAICHSILEKLGGGIRVESMVGQGTVFVITLPYHQ